MLGILWPLASLVVEITTGMTSEIWIDPIPTAWHVLLIAWVPVANAILLYCLQGRRSIPAWLFLLHGLAAGVSILYWIELFPFTIAGVFLFWTGIGLLPLGPVASTIATLRLRAYCRRAQLISAPRWHGAIAAFAGMGILLLLELPAATSALGLTLASNGSASQRASGQKILRHVASEKELVRYAAGENVARLDFYLGRVSDITGLSWPTAEDADREIYRATGKKVARLHKVRFDRDTQRAGTRVGPLLSNVLLAESQAEIIANGHEGYSYTEWTMTFANGDPFQNEARCEVLLPPNGVVSRLTLWVNGSEREAAFAANQQVREAYQRVVARRQDPVLVTASGYGRVLVQCFPVPPRGTMKIRLGITAPLLPETGTAGILPARYTFPTFTDQNFVIKTATTARIRGDVLSPIPNAQRISAENDSYLQSDFTLNAAAPPSFEVSAPSTEAKVWRRDTRDPQNQFIVQTIHKVRPAAAKPVFVVDGSAPLADFAPAIRRALENFPNAPIIFATTDFPKRVTKNSIGEIDFNGGADNTLALKNAVDIAAKDNLDTIVWIHGEQPVRLSPIASLNNELTAHLNMRIISIPLIVGENEILRELNISTRVETHASLFGAVQRLLATNPIWTADYQTHSTLPVGLTEKEASSHIARLWAVQAIQNLLASGDHSKALQLAPRYQLVTAISGAVVLETKQQYDEAGLNPVDGKAVPAVPEPSTWALLFTGLALCVILHRAKRQRLAD